MTSPFWRETSRETLAHGSRFSFVRVHLLAHDGRRSAREIVVHPGAVAIVPVFRPGDPAYQHLAALALAGEAELQALLDAASASLSAPASASRASSAARIRGESQHTSNVINKDEHSNSNNAASESGVVMIWNERAALGGLDVLEVPAGTLEEGELPEVCAGREVIEEAGVVAGSLTSLGTFWTTPGLTDELMHVFAATNLQPAEQDLDDNETIRVMPIFERSLARLIDAGVVRDGKTLAALWRCERRGLIDLKPA